MGRKYDTGQGSINGMSEKGSYKYLENTIVSKEHGKSVNSYDTSVITYSCGIIKWTKRERKDCDGHQKGIS